jgi:CRISPR-associated protein Csx17
LGSYLKALGVLRLVADQADPTATGSWTNGSFRLSSSLDGEALVSFFTDRYQPTPLVAPWNGGSGFGANDPKASPKAVATVENIASSNDERLQVYRDTIAATKALTGRPGWFDLTKDQQVALCRNELPDEALLWLDASVVLTTERLAFPPLLGTGGNDGRFDFSANYMQRLAVVLALEARKRGAATVTELARQTLFGVGDVPLDDMTIGQFDPAGAGGPAAVGFGEASSITNPFDFVLLLEGALLFASSAARRLSAVSSRASVPFMVSASPAGHPTAAAAEKCRGELWAPLWSHPVGLAELAQLIGEGRAEVAGRQADNGLGVAKALSSLGVDRGIDGFVRHAFVERNGLATFAVAVGFHEVRSRPGVAVLGQVERWAARLRRVKNPPGSLPTQLRLLDDAQFEVTSRDSVSARQQVLIAAAALDTLVNRSGNLQRDIGPVRGLRAEDWLPLLDDTSDEFQIAVAVSSMRSSARERRGWLRQFTTPDPNGRPPSIAGFGTRPVTAVFTELLHRLSLIPAAAPPLGEPARWLPDRVAHPASLRAAVRLACGDVDLVKLGRLAHAFAILDWDGSKAVLPDEPPVEFIPASFALLAPFHSSRPWSGSYRGHGAAAPSQWAKQLPAGAVAEVCGDAMRRLRIAQLQTVVRDAGRVADGADGHLLAAACIVPLTDSAVRRLLDRVAITTNKEN